MKADLSVPELVAGARALGLPSKLVVTPLWKALEDPDVSVFDMSYNYTELRQKFLEWAEDASRSLEGTVRPLSLVLLDLTETVTNRLLEPDSSDTMTLEILQVLCGAYGAYTTRLLKDHLPGRKYHDPSAVVQEEGKSVASTNVVSERDFAQLDRFMREEPCARTIALEGIIMFSNRTAEWLSAKNENDRAALLASARQSAPAVQELYKKRQIEIQEHQMKVLKEKEEQITKKKARDVQRREGLANEIAKYSRLHL